MSLAWFRVVVYTHKRKPLMGRKVSDEDFVEAYVLARGIEEVMELTGLSRNGVTSRAASLRRAGVNLPKIRRPLRRVDVKGLNEIVTSLVCQRQLQDALAAEKGAMKTAEVPERPARQRRG
jgi:hypothetical protein